MCGVASAIGGAEAGLGILSSANSSIENAYSSAYQNASQNLQIDYSNRRTKEIFAKGLEQYGTQKQFNADAANRAYSSEQMRLNEAFQAAAFQRGDMFKNLVQAQGDANASERTGNSARRVNTNNLAAFGRDNALLAENLASARGATDRSMADISRQELTANNQAWSQIALPPTMQANIAAPRLNNNNALLGIGSALIGGYKTFKSLKGPT
jgi:hypothetical protein